MRTKVDKGWELTLTCCGREGCKEWFEIWDEADAFREHYCYIGTSKDPQGYSGDGFHGHQRSGVITQVPALRDMEVEE